MFATSRSRTLLRSSLLFNSASARSVGTLPRTHSSLIRNFFSSSFDLDFIWLLRNFVRTRQYSQLTVMEKWFLLWNLTLSRCLSCRHNFFVFPRHEIQVDGPSSEFLCQTTSIEFLAKYQFDFNACIHEGSFVFMFLLQFMDIKFTFRIQRLRRIHFIRLFSQIDKHNCKLVVISSIDSFGPLGY